MVVYLIEKEGLNKGYSMVYSITLYFLASYLTPLAINPPTLY